MCDGESQDRLLRTARTPEPHPRRRRSHHRGHGAVRAGCRGPGDVQPLRGVRGNGRARDRGRRHRRRSRDRGRRVRDRHSRRRPRRCLRRAFRTPRRRAPVLRGLRSGVGRLRRGRDRRPGAAGPEVRPQGRHHLPRARASVPAREPGTAQGQERHRPRSRRPIARASRARTRRQPHRRLVRRARAPGGHGRLRRRHPRHPARARCRRHLRLLPLGSRGDLRGQARHPPGSGRRVRTHGGALHPADHLHHRDGAGARPGASAAPGRARRRGLPCRRDQRHHRGPEPARGRPRDAAERRPGRGCAGGRRTAGSGDHPPARPAGGAAGDGRRPQRRPRGRGDLPRRRCPPERDPLGGGVPVAHLRAAGARDRPCARPWRRGRQGRAGPPAPLRRAAAHTDRAGS